MDTSPLDPHWTDADYLAEETMEDDLGMDAEGRFNLIPRLTPGFTGQTRRARYYSFFTWVIDEFRRDTDIMHNRDSFTLYLRRHENALLLAYLAHGCGTGAVGVTAANIAWSSGSLDKYDVAGWRALPSRSRGAYAQQYSAPLRDMNLTEQEGNLAIPTEPTGLQLAESFRRSVERTRYCREFRKTDFLPRDLIEGDMADSLCLCRLEEFPAERKALTEVFFRFDTPDVYSVQRLSTLCLFLDVIAQSDGSRLSERDFREVVYFRVFADGHAYLPKGNLERPADQWRVLQMQQYYRYAVESLWALFLRGIYQDWRSLAEYLDWFWQGMDLEALAVEFRLDLPATDPGEITLEQFLESIGHALPANYRDLGPDSRAASLNEATLYHALWEARGRPERQISGGYALLLLNLIYLRFKPLHDAGGDLWELARYQRMNEPFRYNDGRLPPAAFFEDVERAQLAGWTLKEWVAWLHQRYLILQHKRVALRRFQEKKQDLASFEYDSDRQQFSGRRERQPALNGLPWDSALSLLQDLALVRASDGQGYELIRPDAQMLLDCFRTYEVPEHPEWEHEAQDEAGS